MKRLVWLAVLVAVLGTASSADAARKFRVIGAGGVGSVWTDGDRYAAITLTGRATRVIDAKSGRRWRVSPPPGCTFDAVAAGQVLWSCPGGSIAPYPWVHTETPALQALGTSTTRPVRGWHKYVDWFTDSGLAQGEIVSGPEPDALGARWLRGYWSCGKCGPQRSYINLRTGELVQRMQERATPHDRLG